MLVWQKLAEVNAFLKMTFFMETKFLNSVIHGKLVQETIYFLKHFAKPTLRNSIRRRTLDWLENPPTCGFFYVFKKGGVWQFSQKSS